MEIASRANPKVKLARSLSQSKARRETGLFLVEGLAHVGAALEAAYPLEFILTGPNLPGDGYAQTLLGMAAQRGIPCHPVAAELFNGLATRENPQGVLAVARWQPADLSGLVPSTHPWLAAVVSPQDPGNLGALLRTLDAVGAHGLILLEDGVDPTHPTTVRASMGALFWLPVARASFPEFADWSERLGFQRVGTSARAPVDYRETQYRSPAILVLGSEREGLSPDQAAACDILVRLPMHGRVSSLNLAVAAGVLLYAMRDAFHPRGG
jgi:TrmH family RNA methyltransferase